MAGKKDDDSDGAALILVLAVGAVIWVIVKLIWWILAAAVLAAAGYGIRAIVDAQVSRREVYSGYAAEMVARADQQYEWALSGDERGTYGTRRPALIEPPRPWGPGRLAAVIAAVVTLALIGAFLLVHHPSLPSALKAEPAQTTLPFSR